MKPFLDLSNRQWNKFYEFGMSEPVRLGVADLSKPFVYERAHGVFYVPAGMHPSSMSLLLAFQQGCADGVSVAEKLGLRYSSGTSEYWLKHTPGAAFRSSVSKRISVATKHGLTRQERKLFGEFGELSEVFTTAEMEQD